MPRSPASSKRSSAASPSAATFPRGSCGQSAGAAVMSCGCPSRARAAASVRRAWVGGWPKGPRSDPLLPDRRLLSRPHSSSRSFSRFALSPGRMARKSRR